MSLIIGNVENGNRKSTTLNVTIFVCSLPPFFTHMLRKGEKIRGREARAWLARDGTLMPFHNKLIYRYNDASQTSKTKKG